MTKWYDGDPTISEDVDEHGEWIVLRFPSGGLIKIDRFKACASSDREAFIRTELAWARDHDQEITNGR